MVCLSLSLSATHLHTFWAAFHLINSNTRSLFQWAVKIKSHVSEKKWNLQGLSGVTTENSLYYNLHMSSADCILDSICEFIFCGAGRFIGYRTSTFWMDCAMRNTNHCCVLILYFSVCWMCSTQRHLDVPVGLLSLCYSCLCASLEHDKLTLHFTFYFYFFGHESVEKTL